METWQILAIGVVIVIAAVLGWWFYERHRSERLKQRFGPEYDRRVEVLGRRQAESELARSEARVEKLKGRPLSATDRTRFMQEWRLCQARFVDDPGGAVLDADRILTDIMRVRGYAVDDPYDRVSDISAAYPPHTSAYHEANDILTRHRGGNASTEDLRKAFIDFRSLFDDALGGRDEERERVA